MATWAEFERSVPGLTTKGRALLYQYGPPLGYIATARHDGGPRVHPFCPIVAEGGLMGLHFASFTQRRRPSA
jgi:hypothetical protein